MTYRINLKLPDELSKDFDEVADSEGITRTALHIIAMKLLLKLYPVLKSDGKRIAIIDEKTGEREYLDIIF